MTPTAGRSLFAWFAGSVALASACSTTPSDGQATGGQANEDPLPVDASGGSSGGSRSTGGWTSAGGGSHTDCFQGCNLCVDGIHYYAPSHPAYDHDCCSIATQTVCEFGCDPRPYMGCLAAPAYGGNGGATN